MAPTRKSSLKLWPGVPQVPFRVKGSLGLTNAGGLVGMAEWGKMTPMEMGTGTQSRAGAAPHGSSRLSL